MVRIEMVMKTLPARPYLTNIAAHYLREHGIPGPWQGFGLAYDEYAPWLKQFGFKVPVDNNILEFTDDFSDKDLMLFVLRWS